MILFGLLILSAFRCICNGLENCDDEDSITYKHQITTCPEDEDCSKEIEFRTTEELEEKLTEFFRRELTVISWPSAGRTSNEITSSDDQKSTPERECKHSKFTFLSEEKAIGYILYNGTVPELTDVSVCARLSLEPINGIKKGTLLSYYKPGSNHGNTLTILFNVQETLQIMIHGSSWSTWRNIPSVNQSHFCFLISAGGKWAEIFINGVNRTRKPLTEFVSEQSIDTIPEGGALVIGTDQDEAKPGQDKCGKFVGEMKPEQTFSGEMADLYIWNRVLNETEILKFYHRPCDCPHDYLIGFNESNARACGNATVNWNDTCEKT